MPPLGETASTFDESFEMVSFVLGGIPVAEPEDDWRPPTQLADGPADARERAESRCDPIRGGSMGKPEAAETQRRYGAQGPPDNPDPHLARTAVTQPWDAWTGGQHPVGGWGGDLEAPVVAYGRNDSLGNDERSARGNTWGDDLGTALGSPGAGLGRRVLCDHCGDVGLGLAREDSGTSLGGTTGTESAAARLR